MAVKQLPTLSPIPEPPNRLVGDQERFDTMTFNSLKAQEKMVNVDLNQNVIPALNQFAVDVNASVDAAALSERNAHDSEEVAKRKAGEASGSAGAAKVSEDNAKVSETNALASKNAAALSAESAEADRIAAEAARDEAQDLANVGYASESHAGLAKVDGKTTQSDAGGTITAKDVAIGGNLEDLVSARGIFDTLTKGSVDCNTLTEQGVYAISLAGTVNGPGFSAKLVVFNGKGSVFTNQMAIASGAGTSGAIRVAYRSKNNGNVWSPWSEGILSGRVGDGITVNNGIISVPEYEGATASTAGTSGLVPPATAGQQESFLTGGGEYKPALTKISDSVSLADSTAAASAKAVKTAYDLANSKQANLGFTPVQQGGGAGQEGQKIYIGWSPSGLKAQADALNLGNIVTTSAGCTKAPSAANADRLRLTEGGETAWSWTGQGGQPGWLWGGNDGVNMYVYNPSNFSVNYANSAGSALIAAPAVQWVVNLSGPQITVPPGGTYNVVCICFNDSGGKGAVKHYPNTAGGTVIPNAPTDYFVAGLCARVA